MLLFRLPSGEAEATISMESMTKELSVSSSPSRRLIFSISSRFRPRLSSILLSPIPKSMVQVISLSTFLEMILVRYFSAASARELSELT